MKRRGSGAWAVVRILAILVLSISFPAYAQDTAISGEDAFRQAIELLEIGDHENAIPLLEIALEERPESPGALWNLGTSAIVTNRYELATNIWTRYRAVAPDDWQALPKLVQTHQGTGSFELRDRARAELFRLFEDGSDQRLSQEVMYCREQYALGSSRVLAYEYFQPFSTDRPRFYEFFVTDAEANILFSVSFGSYETTNSIDLETGGHGPDERLYHFDAYYPEGGHRTLGFITRHEVMEYDEARQMMASFAADLMEEQSARVEE